MSTRQRYSALSRLLALSLALSGLTSIHAETGMCLVVKCGSFDGSGDIIRIDLKDNQVINTSGKLGYGKYPRFSPDGTEFAYANGRTVYICELDGTVKKSFTAAEEGKLTYTNDGIYIGSSGEIRLYDLNGNKTWQKSFSYCSGAQVARNGSIGTGVAKKNNWNVHIYNLSTGETNSIDGEQGCSACPSPDGSRFTQNLHGHTTMRIRKADGTKERSLDIKSCTGLDPNNGNWRWNRQTWSGNSNDWIILPCGQAGSSSSEQLDKNCSPWIYNLSTTQSIRLASRSSDFWQPYDYYSGKVYDSTTPSLKLSKTGLTFQTDVGVNPGAQTLTASTDAGSLESVSVSGAPSWLSVDLSATSGNNITLTNTVDVGGLAADEYQATMTVGTGNAGTKTYTVSLSVKAVPVFTSIAISPEQGMVAPGKTLQFVATALDQHGDPMADQPGFDWSVEGDGSIFNAGLFTAGTAEGGPYTVTATSGSIEGTATVRVAKAPDTHIKVNCGSNSFAVDGWEQDDGYLSSGDAAETHDWSGTISTSGVTNAAPADVYKSVIHRDHAYRFDVPDGDYTLRLHLADEYGDRTMTYTAEGIAILSSYDIVSEVGTGKALVKDFAVTVADGNGLQLACDGNGGDVFECGIEVIGFTATSPLVLTGPEAGTNWSVGGIMPVSWEASSTVQGVVIEFSPDGGKTWIPVLEESVGPSDPGWSNYEWTIPETIGADAVSTQSTNCKIRLYDYQNESIEAVSGVFAIGAQGSVANAAGIMAGRAFSIGRVEDGMRVAITAPVPYQLRIVAADGRTLYARTGQGPVEHVCTHERLPAGALFIRLTVGEERLVRRMVRVP